MNILAQDAPARQAPRPKNASKPELTPAEFYQIAARIQASARRRLDRLPVISRAKTPTTGGL